MKKNTLRLTVIALVAAVCAPLFLSSCSKDVNTRVATFTITDDLWRWDSGDETYKCDFAWSALDNDALSVGTVNAYLILRSDDGNDYQQPLPYVYYDGLHFYDTNFFVYSTDTVTDSNFNGMWVPQSINIRYDVSPGRITFMLCTLGHHIAVPYRTMRFRAVVTYPVEY